MPPRIGTAAYLKQRYRADPAFAYKVKAASYRRTLAKGGIARPGAKTLQRYDLGGLARELGLKVPPLQLSLDVWKSNPVDRPDAPDAEAHAAQHLGGAFPEI